MAIEITEDHPLSLELTSLRTAVSRYQHEAHAASVKLQRHSLDTTHALEGARLLEQENQRLAAEVAVLRATPDVTPHPASLQVPELTLALRKLSDKLTFTEEALVERTNELATAQSALTQSQLEVKNAQSLAAEARNREAAVRSQALVLEQKAKAAEEERKMVDLVVQEYADLVRSLEGRARGPRPSIQITREASSSSVTLVESLAEGKNGLQKLLEEFNSESERHAADMFQLQGKLAALAATLESEHKNSDALHAQLASALTELEKHKADDKTAAKMVSRYMKFSQTTTNSLQKAMENLKTRHVATTATLESQIDSLQKSLQFERRQSDTLRHALDELSEDISREAYGRRREISLRLAVLGREEGLAESLRRWTRKSKESFARVLSKQSEPTDNSLLVTVFDRIMHDAEHLLESLNGLQSYEDEPAPGSVARILAAQDAVATLTRELHQETSRRLEDKRRLTQLEPPDDDSTLETIVSPVAEAVSPNANDGAGSVLQLTNPPKRTVSLSPSPSLPKTVAESTSTNGSLDDVSTSRSQEDTPQTPSTPSSILHESSSIPPISPSVLDMSQLGSSADTLFTSSPATPTHASQKLSDFDALDKQSELSQPSPHLQPMFTDNARTPQHPVEDLLTSERPLSDAGNVDQDDVFNISVPEILVPSAQPPVSSEAQEEIDNPGPPSDELDPMVPPISFPIGPPSGESAAAEVDVSQSDSHVSEVLATHSPATISTASSLQREPSPAPDIDIQQRLLGDLRTTQHRYDDLQRSFRDSDLALKDLKRDVANLPDNLEMVLVVQTAVERLKDFNEDARVELEIRISDEERIYTGYTTLLSVPGAISEEVDVNELESEIEAFVSGTEKGVTKAMHQLTRKLDDLQHDIASVKLTVHELASSAEQQQESDAAAVLPILHLQPLGLS
ncbi:hypothetical protein EUX98_g4350 [Antrodiella citrinella]|uniref:Uncharacterized protein n=1 Tax=Antrodiella citrinella TaxID=2447956 RepID=A0A4V3XIN0_9APHY|nr:hypothetical protein EUX98_g4350 [Antrodiella citrinella]